MHFYRYNSKDRKGRTRKGYIEANSEQEVHLLLEKQGLFPISIQKTTPALKILERVKVLNQKVSRDELILFTEQFSTLISSGISILEALEGLYIQSENKYFGKVIRKIEENLEQGKSIKKAFSEFPRVFPPLYINLLGVGEITGTLDKLLLEIAKYLEKEEDLRKKVSAAFAYPKFVAVITSLVILFMVSFVLPSFAKLYSQAGESLPKPTKLVISISGFITNQWIYILVAISLVYFAYRLYYSTRIGRYQIDKLKLKIPLFGRINLYRSLSLFTHSLSIILQSGIDLVSGMETAANASGNVYLVGEFVKIQEKIRSGKSFFESISDSKIFPSILAQMIAVGEKSGSLDILLGKISEIWDRNIDHILKNLAAKIEPITIIVLGFVVGFIALSMYLPMFGLPSLYKKIL